VTIGYRFFNNLLSGLLGSKYETSHMRLILSEQEGELSNNSNNKIAVNLYPRQIRL
jgi:hypothetical protein